MVCLASQICNCNSIVARNPMYSAKHYSLEYAFYLSSTYGWPQLHHRMAQRYWYTSTSQDYICTDLEGSKFRIPSTKASRFSASRPKPPLIPGSI